MYNKKVLIDSLKKLGSAKAPTVKKDFIVDPNKSTQTLSMKKGGSTVDKKVSVRKSNIQGKGLFINQPVRKGEIIGLAHLNNQATPIVGKYHNHSEENPTAVNIEQGNKRYLVAARDLPAGTEITTNYRLQPELEQPEDFMQKGGQMTPQKDGYRTYSPFQNLPYIDVKSNTIDTDNIVTDLKLVGDNGIIKNVKKNSGLHKIPGASTIREIPLKKKQLGGLTRFTRAGNKMIGLPPAITHISNIAPKVNIIPDVIPEIDDRVKRNLVWGFDEYTGGDPVNLPGITNYTGAGVSSPIDLKKYLGDFDFQDFSDGWAARQAMMNMTSDPQWTPGKKDFYTNKEVLDLIDKQKKWKEAYDTVREMFPESPDKTFALVKDLFPNVEIQNPRTKFLLPHQFDLLDKENVVNYDFGYRNLLDKWSLDKLVNETNVLPDTFSRELFDELTADSWVNTADAKDVVTEMGESLGLKIEDINNATPEQLETWRKQIIDKKYRETREKFKLDPNTLLKGSDAYNQLMQRAGSRNQFGGSIDKLKKGGSAPSMPKKNNPKAYSRSLEATNRLLAEHPFFAKPKSRRKKIYDPNSKYYQNGGELDSEVDVTILPEDGRSYYDPLIDQVYLNPFATEDEVNHELVHGWQNRTGALRSDPFSPKMRPSAAASDEQAATYFNRKGDDVQYYMNNMQSIYPEMTGNIWTSDMSQFIPEEIQYNRAIEPLMYYDPNTMEGEAEWASQSYGPPPLQLNFKQDGGVPDGMNGMMKSRLAYANEFGNPAAKRMVNAPDNPYQFDNGETGTHYMASMDNYAVPQIQDENGQLVFGDYGPDSNEAMQFNSPEDADYFAKYYKRIAPDPSYQKDWNPYQENNDSFLQNDSGPRNNEGTEEYAKGGLTKYAPGGDWPPRWLAKNNSNIYFNPVYTNSFTGATNSLESFNNPNNFPVYKVDPSAVVGIEGGLGKRDLRDLTPRGWSYNAYAGLPYSGIKDKNYIPSLGIKFNYENSPQDTIFRPHAEIAADFGTGTGLNISGTGGLRFPLLGRTEKLKPGYGGGHIDIYGGGKAGLGKDNASAGVVYGARIHGKYQPRWLDKISRGSYFYGDAGIQFDPVKGKQSQPKTLYELATLQDEQGNPIVAHSYGKEPGVKWGLTPYANFGIKKDIDRINFDKKKKKIQAFEDDEKIYERERKVTPNTQGTVPFTYSRDQQKDGGIILDLTKDQIDRYVDGGYIVEDISVPELNQAQLGGLVKAQKGLRVVRDILVKPTPDQRLTDNFVSSNFGPSVTSQYSADFARRMAALNAIRSANNISSATSTTDHIINQLNAGLLDPQQVIGAVGNNKISRLTLDEAKKLVNQKLDPTNLSEYFEYPLSIVGKSGKITLLSNTPNDINNNLWHFTAFMNNPREAGLAFNYMNRFFPFPKPSIQEDTSLSLDSFNLMANMGKHPDWDIEHVGYVPLNNFAKHHKASDLFENAGYFTGMGTLSAPEDLSNEALRRLNQFIAERGLKEEALKESIGGNNWILNVPNYKLTRKYQEGGDYELGDEVDEATMIELKKLGYTFEKI